MKPRENETHLPDSTAITVGQARGISCKHEELDRQPPSGLEREAPMSHLKMPTCCGVARRRFQASVKAATLHPDFIWQVNGTANTPFQTRRLASGMEVPLPKLPAHLLQMGDTDIG
eukprot:CAMPEP_0180421822 /NCGR_PEP_ID=MMETSP1036_2-20121128/3354_1 /TAXON_ID=632150 /ORGANISM="Azadinium spinosum, Strain 3D9" /LENGTH=115 /DNA_ID=CAMNT_0022427109 /DNA_START=921 /DNA_END=1269 /DNA_ORIENTATION=+